MSTADLKGKARARFGPKEGQLLWNTETGAIEGEIRTVKDLLATFGAHVLGPLEGPRMGRPPGSGYFKSIEGFVQAYKQKRSDLTVIGQPPPSDKEISVAMGLYVTIDTGIKASDTFNRYMKKARRRRLLP